ncbi:MAG: glutamate-1-semialdehyde 2,1-aminomutase [Fibrobacteraceae bacterium]|nr:glutamate-1-semialdehyde 2,1-aminomutase [Fibrobacteraceae bacterium]
MNLWEKACQVLPGGVNSPVRAFGSVGGTPIFMEKALGPHIYDISGKSYIDLVLSFGPMILGHNPKTVIQALEEQLTRGLSFGACTGREVELAEKILSCLPSMEMLRLVNSGTEATMSAVRVARGYTKREKILKFRGCYHGHGDSFLIQAGSGALTHGVPSSLGVTEGTAKDTLVADYNHLEEVQEIFKTAGNQIAAVIVEPVAGNMGVVPPAPGFLEGLRELCDLYGSLLIFDEVMTGFRLARGGAASLYSVVPDMITLGKIVGGGMPLAAYASRREIMEMVSPLGGVYQAGTLSGNPMAVTAGFAQMEQLLQESPWEKLEASGKKLEDSLIQANKNSSLPIKINRVGSMLTVFFSENPVTDTTTALASNAKLFSKFFHGMLKRGIYLPPSQYEAAFLSTTHDDLILQKIVSAASEVFQEMKREF